MATIPPPIDVVSPETRKAWINGYQAGLWAAVQNIDNTAIFMHAGMLDLLQKEGLDHSGRFSGSSASKAAGSVTSKLKRASQHINSAIILMKGADAAAEKNVDAPVRAAREARTRAKNTYTV
jgi:hypothetical protein